MLAAGEVGARRPHQHGVPEHVGHPRHRRRWSSPRPAWTRRWARSPRCCRRSSGRSRRCSGSSTRSPRCSASSPGRRSRSSSSSGWPAASRGSDVLLLGTAMAISAIPTGLPTFVPAMLSYGAKQLAEAKAVVKNLTDVETLGATSAINSDKTGTLTMNEMMVSSLYTGGAWFTVEGEGYRKTGQILAAAGAPTPDFTRLALRPGLDSDATVSDDGAVVGDPTEAALVVLAAKLGVDAEETRRTYPRLAEVPFDSAYKFMATFHRVPVDGAERVVELVKGGPDVVLARCTRRGRPAARAPGPDRRGVARPSRRPTGRWPRRACGCSPSPPAFLDDGRATTRSRPTRCRSRGAHVRRHGRHHRPAAAEAKVAVEIALRRRHRRPHDHRRPRGHRAGDRRETRPRPGRDQRRRAPGDDRRGADAPAAEAARVRPGHPRGQAAPGPAHAGAGPGRRHDRRRRQRRRRAQAGRHRRRDGHRQRGHQAGRPA